MSTTDAPAKLMTADEFLALPDDGKERWLLHGVVYTLENSMTVRNWVHASVVANIAHVLRAWILTQPHPRGRISAGDGGFRLQRDPDVLIGADVAYASAQLALATPRGRAYYDGPPTLAVEVLSPSDRHDETVEKIQNYLDCGVVVWIVDADLRHVMVYRPNGRPQALALGEDLTTEPELPGFRVAVADLFDL